jgi:hypothetical protein
MGRMIVHLGGRCLQLDKHALTGRDGVSNERRQSSHQLLCLANTPHIGRVNTKLSDRVFPQYVQSVDSQLFLGF